MTAALRPGGVTVIDVRTPNEFSTGHAVGSINIPITEIIPRLVELRLIEDRIILCCASGVRSKRAYDILHQHGFKNIADGGSWMTVQSHINTTN